MVSLLMLLNLQVEFSSSVLYSFVLEKEVFVEIPFGLEFDHHVSYAIQSEEAS